jgi:hypothetical protein
LRTDPFGGHHARVDSPWRWRFHLLLTAGTVGVLLLGPGAFAQESPTPASGATGTTASASPEVSSPTTHTPTVDGSVTGSHEAGDTLEIRADALMPGGWQGLHLVEVTMTTGGQAVDALSYDIEDARITLDGHNVAVGTGAAAKGAYLGIDGSRIAVTFGGANLSLKVDADVLRTIPDDARFQIAVIGDRGERASVTTELERPKSTGFTWGTVISAVVLALFAGGLVGNVFASRRRPPARLSVYGTVQRRIDSERQKASPPK